MTIRKYRVLIFLTIIISAFNDINSSKFVIGEHGVCGFFCTLEGTLYRIIWAIRHKRIPVVYWGPRFLYYQKQGYNGSFNGWEYYFEPVSKLKYKPGDRIHKAYTGPGQINFLYINKFYDKKFHKNKLWVHNFLTKYIKIKPNIRIKINSFYNKYMRSYNIIGIHLRGTDKYKEAKKIDPYKILFTAQRIARNRFSNNCKYFIATDDNTLLNLAKKVLHHNNVIHCNFRKSSNGQPIHFSGGNSAFLGEQVLIDTILLSRCKYFVHTLSNVATFVMLFNPKIKNFFVT